MAAAAGADAQMSAAIAPATVKRAISIINACVLPTAQAVLSPVSTAEVVRDARRIIDHLRVKTSAQKPRFERRPLLLSWQDSMPTARLDAAIALLEGEKLLTAVEKSGGTRVRRGTRRLRSVVRCQAPPTQVGAETCEGAA